MRIQDLVKGGGPASEAESCRRSEASILRPGSRAHLRALEAFGFLMLKYAFSHILETLFLQGPRSFWVFDAQICIFTHSRDSFFSYF